jgi:hypothetical protein
MSKWKAVSDGGLPPIGIVVLVSYKSGYDEKPIFAWGARLDGDEGWCWGIEQRGCGIRPDEDAKWNGVEADDDYEVTHWMPLPHPPHGAA